MAEVNTNNGRENRKGRPTKRILRVDFTPMVDMNMLLITFFMFCTTLSIPQVMDIVIPTKERDAIHGTKVTPSKTITIILDGDNKIYYYYGIMDFGNDLSFKKTDYKGLRNILLDKNSELVAKAVNLRLERQNKKISESEFRKQMSELKKLPESAIVIIKPTDQSSYENLVDALDEMQVCNIGKYAIVEVEESDRYMIDNYEHKNVLTASL